MLEAGDPRGGPVNGAPKVTLGSARDDTGDPDLAPDLDSHQLARARCFTDPGLPIGHAREDGRDRLSPAYAGLARVARIGQAGTSWSTRPTLGSCTGCTHRPRRGWPVPDPRSALAPGAYIGQVGLILGGRCVHGVHIRARSAPAQALGWPMRAWGATRLYGPEGTRGWGRANPMRQQDRRTVGHLGHSRPRRRDRILASVARSHRVSHSSRITSGSCLHQ